MEEKNKLETVKEKYEESFQAKKPSYEKLALNIKLNLEALLKENSIDFMEVNYRIKESDSFCEKICRKEKEKNITIDNPFEEVQDICGIRIICYYVIDLKKIDRIIRKNFQIIDSEYKNEKLKENEFGYLSNHYIVKLKEEWLKLPILKGLENWMAEIQVRTILMHAWADISHKLNYKQANTDKILARKLNQLSALFEIADSHFITLKNASQKKYSEEIKEAKIPEEYSIDLMRAIFKDYIKIENIERISDEMTEDLIKNLKRLDVLPSELVENFIFINEKEKEMENIIKEFYEKKIIHHKPLNEYGYTNVILLLTNDTYFGEMKKRYDFSSCEKFMKIRNYYKKNKINDDIKE